MANNLCWVSMFEIDPQKFADFRSMVDPLIEGLLRDEFCGVQDGLGAVQTDRVHDYTDSFNSSNGRLDPLRIGAGELAATSARRNTK